LDSSRAPVIHIIRTAWPDDIVTVSGINHQMTSFSGLANALGQAETRRMQTTTIRWSATFFVATFILGLAKPLAETEAPAKPKADAPTAGAKQAELFKRFEKTLTNAEMTGQFTIVGKEVPPIKESYTIHSVKKMSQGDYWVFTARIKYGKKDITLPMPLQVKWAGDKPVIYLDNVTIPGLGTFSSYTVIDGDKYAGTWQHGDVGGHMFGTITPAKPKAPAPKAE
tara:strand:- start:405 stop:1079 length:675 start_codon:yes stop_codon:yes gene_type:complete